MQINTQTIPAGKYPANQELKFIKSKLVCTLAYALYTQFSIPTFYPKRIKIASRSFPLQNFRQASTYRIHTFILTSPDLLMNFPRTKHRSGTKRNDHPH